MLSSGHINCQTLGKYCLCYIPHNEVRGDTGMTMPMCLPVCPSVCLDFVHMVSDDELMLNVLRCHLTY